MHKRQITDGVLLVSEIWNSLKAKKCNGLIFKLDFEKAFDSVDWDFLLHLMRVMNFGPRWVKWIEDILRSSRISILVNGSPTKEFSPERGVRQGDPLSPLLFNLVGEVLHLMLDKASELGIFQGLSFSQNGVTLSHLQYTDDTVIFLHNDQHSVEGVKSVLQGFQVLTGLKINFHKSHIFGFREEENLLNHWVNVLGCQMGGNSMNYLGVNIGPSPKSSLFWDPLMSNLNKKLASWKGNSVSEAGRLILL